MAAGGDAWGTVEEEEEPLLIELGWVSGSSVVSGTVDILWPFLPNTMC